MPERGKVTICGAESAGTGSNHVPLLSGTVTVMEQATAYSIVPTMALEGVLVPLLPELGGKKLLLTLFVIRIHIIEYS
jgi:hypothetical protein